MGPFLLDDQGASMNLQDWIGRQETVVDQVTPTPIAALCATLDRPVVRPEPGTSIPAPWHWLYFLPMIPQAEIGPDGHAKRGGFLPPVPLPRRMWAGSQMTFHEPIQIGDQITRTSTIDQITEKSGRSGSLVFVKVRHEIRRNQQSSVALTEFHDIVYRDAPAPGAAAPTPELAAPYAPWVKRWTPDDVLLFRYSALTFNGHRIHYDRRYVTEVEGYPGLIVHGPLIATLLLDLVRDHRPDAQILQFEFKAIRPTFDLHHFEVCGEPAADGQTIRLWARDHEGYLTMSASAVLG